MKTACIIVLYNKKIDESNAYDSLKNSFIDVYFADNSTKEEIQNYNKAKSQELNLNYVSMEGNKGLSKTYNHMIDHLKQLNYDYVMISDDDTVYTQEFLNELKSKLDLDYDVYLPVIKDAILGHWASPAVRINHKTYTGHAPADEYKLVGAFNSGMCIKMSCYDNWQYNEDYFLYFVDTDFCKNNITKNNLKCLVLDSVILQYCSASEPFSDDSLRRLQLVLDDAKFFYPNKMIYFVYKVFLIKTMWKQHHDKRVFKLISY